LMLECDGLKLTEPRIQLSEQGPVHRTAGTTGADEVPATELIIEHVTVGLSTDVADRVLHDRRTGALQQPGIELEPPDRMLHAGYPQMQPLDVDMQAVERQEPVRIGGDVHLQIADNLRSNPPRTELQAGKCLLVEHEHVRAAPLQLPCRSRAGRPATYY